MELRELRAFVTAAQEQHFARAAELLHMSPSTMSELIRRLELELGTPLFTRTTRRITLTDAGTELLGHAQTILDLAARASEAVGTIARGNAGSIRLGVTPPAAHVIAPHLVHGLTASQPEITVDIQRMWLPALAVALQAGTIDVALTCGELELDNPHITTVEIGREQLLVGLRPDHPLTQDATIDLQLLAHKTLGIHPARLFPAWNAAQHRILADARLTPPTSELNDTDLTARSWTLQPEIEWIMLISSLLTGQADTIARQAPGHTVPFTLSWTTQTAQRAVIQRFIKFTEDATLPPGWLPPLPK